MSVSLISNITTSENLISLLKNLNVKVKVLPNLLNHVLLHICITQNESKAYISLRNTGEWEVLGDFLLLWDKSPKIRTCMKWEKEKLLNHIIDALKEK